MSYGVQVTEDRTSPVLLGVLIAILGSSAAFTFGYLKGKWDRARADYLDTRAKVVPLRKAKWLVFWAMTKTGFWVILVGAFLIFWVIHDATETGQP